MGTFLSSDSMFGGSLLLYKSAIENTYAKCSGSDISGVNFNSNFTYEMLLKSDNADFTLTPLLLAFQLDVTNQYDYTAANQSAMLALTAKFNEICKRTDSNKYYRLTGSDPTLLASWHEIVGNIFTLVSVRADNNSELIVYTQDGLITNHTGIYLLNYVWDYIAMTFDVSNDLLRIYLNGNPLSSFSLMTSTKIQSSAPYQIIYGTPARQTTYLIDCMRMFNSVKTAADILAAYKTLFNVAINASINSFTYTEDDILSLTNIDYSRKENYFFCTNTSRLLSCVATISNITPSSLILGEYFYCSYYKNSALTDVSFKYNKDFNSVSSLVQAINSNATLISAGIKAMLIDSTNLLVYMTYGAVDLAYIRCTGMTTASVENAHSFSWIGTVGILAEKNLFAQNSTMVTNYGKIPKDAGQTYDASSYVSTLNMLTALAENANDQLSVTIRLNLLQDQIYIGDKVTFTSNEWYANNAVLEGMTLINGLIVDNTPQTRMINAVTFYVQEITHDIEGNTTELKLINFI